MYLNQSTELYRDVFAAQELNC